MAYCNFFACRREVDKDVYHSRAADQMRREVILLVALTLGGCIPHQAHDVAACQAEADRFYQTYHAVDPDDPSSQYIIACMAAKGYDFTITPADCDSRHALPTQPACYTPNNWFGWIVDRIRRQLK